MTEERPREVEIAGEIVGGGRDGEGRHGRGGGGEVYERRRPGRARSERARVCGRVGWQV